MILNNFLSHQQSKIVPLAMRLRLVLLSVITASIAGPSFAADNESDTSLSLRILETTDLHANVMDFNYYRGETDSTIGLARTAVLIDNARLEVDNIVLVDNGDLIQGSPMGDYIAKQGLVSGQVHPVYKAMNTLEYSVGNLGNHEFNYGLPYLFTTLSGAGFPYINANVYCDADDCANGKARGDNLFTPYIIEPKTVTDIDGDIQLIKIGYIGFVPPQIMLWDKANLTDKVRTEGIVETAEKFIPEMLEKGADIIVAIPHSGIGSSENPGDPRAENATYALTEVDGINAIMFGHSHSVFPHARYADLPNTDIEKGLLNGVPAVMPGRWGDNLGIIDLELSRKDGVWAVTNSQSEARPIYDSEAKLELVEPSQTIRATVAEEHAGTLAFVDAPIGQASANLYSFLTLVQDDPTVQIVSDAQIANVTAKLPAGLQDLPVLSASAPFKAGGRHSVSSDADQYVQVDAGPLSFKNAADLYLYPNTMVALKVTGAELKDWLECSANQFNQIDTTSSEPQMLINWAGHPTYNFDVIDGVSYQIDVTQPSRFDSDCALVNPDAERIVDLSYSNAGGEEITGEALDSMSFIVASNNYRAFGGKFAGTGSDHVAIELPDANRDALADYITTQSDFDADTNSYKSMVNPSADNNWQFKFIESDTPLDIRFETQDTEKAATFIAENQLYPMQKVDTDEYGFAIYQLDLQTQP